MLRPWVRETTVVKISSTTLEKVTTKVVVVRRCPAMGTTTGYHVLRVEHVSSFLNAK
jgi:hypothetical protein